jgi:hypothetical protein
MGTKKVILSKGQFGDLLKSGTYLSFATLDMIDMVVTIECLCPQFMIDLKVVSILDLDAIDSLELLKVYKDEVEKFILDWDVIITSYLRPVETKIEIPIEGSEDKI